MPHAKPRLLRDPIHDIIVWAPDRPEGRLLLELLDTPEVQRLRHIRQLALSSLVYHGAEHSRFAHSVGVAWVAHRMLAQVGAVARVDEGERLVTLAAALLHDIGHGPFSHALEAVTGEPHEGRTVSFLRAPESGVHRVLAAVDPAMPEAVAGRLEHSSAAQPGPGPGPEPGGGGRAFLDEIVSSQLDADRMDYILRDGHATGVKIGAFDLERILAMLDVAHGHLAVHAGAQEAVEGYLIARFHMYKQVYLHKTSRAAERMLEAALRRAATLRRAGAGPSYWPDGALGALVLGEPVGVAAFGTLDDHDIWSALKRWARDEDRPLADLAGGLVGRRIWKTLPLPSDDDDRAEEMVAAARAVARVRGFDEDFHVLVDEAHDSPYRPFTGVGRRRGVIRIVERGGGRAQGGGAAAPRVSLIEDRSEVVRLLGGLVHRRRQLCFHPDLRRPLSRLVE